jgi:hypothetical protein
MPFPCQRDEDVDRFKLWREDVKVAVASTIRLLMKASMSLDVHTVPCKQKDKEVVPFTLACSRDTAHGFMQTKSKEVVPFTLACARDKA